VSAFAASAALPQRARLIIVRDGAIALIERRRAGRRYYVFPGGGVEEGETPEIAAAREATEELGLTVAVGRAVAALLRGGVRQEFFLATPTGGRFGTGCGPEMRGEYPPERGTYRAVWLPLAELPKIELRPYPVAAFLAAVGANGWQWPAGVTALHE
jgi:8-oxo-dGTP pyrophosphatase MutT (NUDIX family)